MNNNVGNTNQPRPQNVRRANCRNKAVLTMAGEERAKLTLSHFIENRRIVPLRQFFIAKLGYRWLMWRLPVLAY